MVLLWATRVQTTVGHESLQPEGLAHEVYSLLSCAVEWRFTADPLTDRAAALTLCGSRSRVLAAWPGRQQITNTRKVRRSYA